MPETSSPRRPLRTLSPEQQERLWAFLQERNAFSGPSSSTCLDTCLIILMLDAGLRIAEVCGLQRSDLWFGEGPVIDLTVRSEIAKNKTVRTVPLSNRLREAIKNLHDFYWPSLQPTTGATTNPAAQSFCSITPRQVQRIVKQITILALGMAFNPHALRHTFATKMMHLTDIRTVQMLLGHASLTSTQVYTHPSLSDLRAAINKTNGNDIKSPDIVTNKSPVSS